MPTHAQRDAERRGGRPAAAARPGAGRPPVAGSNLGVRQATARTVKETTSAATAPAMASCGGIGRSAGPPRPWANVSQSSHVSGLRAAARAPRARAAPPRPRRAGRSSAAGGWCPAPYARVCSGSECTCSSPGWSDVTTSTTSSPTATWTRSTAGASPPSKAISISCTAGSRARGSSASPPVSLPACWTSSGPWARPWARRSRSRPGSRPGSGHSPAGRCVARRVLSISGHLGTGRPCADASSARIPRQAQLGTGEGGRHERAAETARPGASSPSSRRRRRCTTRRSRSSTRATPASTTTGCWTLIADRISFVPRYRQRLQSVPGRLANPVWLDDPHFDLGLPRTPLRAAASGHHGPAARAGRPDRLPAARPRPAALGGLLRRGAGRRPGRGAVEVAPRHGRRGRHRRPRPGAARRQCRGASRSAATSGAPGRRAVAARAGRRRARRLRPASRGSCSTPSAATPRRSWRTAGAVADRAGRVAEALANRRPVPEQPDHGRAVPAAAGRHRPHRPRRLPHRSARRTAARSTTSSWRPSRARCAAG